MPSTDLNPPKDARAVARRYLRYERLLTGLVVVALTLAIPGTYILTSLVPAVAVAAVLLGVVRAPVFETRGTVRLETDAPLETVVGDFTGPTPPVLAFQWGVADAVEVDGGTATYRISYLFGLRAVEMTVRTRTDVDEGGKRTVELEVTAGGEPWSTYTVRVDERGGRTVVAYEYASDRRFGLRRLPQRLVAGRFRDAALAAQGYTTVERDGTCGI